jgi:flagellar hook-length control protein FliK
MDTASTATQEVSKDGTSKEQLKAVLSTHTDALSALLQGKNELEKKEEKLAAKGVDEAPKGIQASKADSLEVKSKEAAQSMRHFAVDLKEAAESYKPPFTRVTMKLNPEKLGEVEVTLVQRGNNVHVNIQSSNASSVAFLAHNATELKAQLAGQGISNATMNFMSGGENQQQNSQNQQQQQPNRFQAYESLQELESAQQELSALEIILPHYA